MFLLVEAVADFAVWAPVKLAADNPSAAFDEAELRFRGWKNCRVSKLYFMDRNGNMKLIHDFVNEHPVFQGQRKAERVCILTGAPGENEDDCTTHDHEENLEAEV